MDQKMILLGMTLIGVAVVPTPDDVTVISPLLQLAVGSGLVLFGAIKKG